MHASSTLQRFIRPQLVIADEVFILCTSKCRRIHRVLHELIRIVVRLALIDYLI